MVMITNSFDKFPNEPTGLMYEQFGKIGLNPAPSVTFSDDFSSSPNGWTLNHSGSGQSISGGALISSVSPSNGYKAFAIGNPNNFVIDLDWELTTLDTPVVILSSDTSGYGDPSSGNRRLHLIGSANSDGNLRFSSRYYATGTSKLEDNGTLVAGGTSASTGVKYFYRFVKSSTSMTFKRYLTASDRTSGANLQQETTATDNAPNSGLSDYAYIEVSAHGSLGTNKLYDFKLYSGVTSPSPSPKVKQHFIEYFSGKQLPSYWTQSEVNPPASFAMNDSVDGGFRITAGGGALNEGMINFNNKRVFSKSGCVCIWVGRDVQTSSYTGYYGLANGITGNDSDMGQLATIYNASANGVIALRTGNTTKGNTESTISLDTNFHTYKIEMKTSSAEWSVDGVAQTTRTLTLPTLDLQPVAGVHGNNKSIDVRYCEAYNT